MGEAQKRFLAIFFIYIKIDYVHAIGGSTPIFVTKQKGIIVLTHVDTVLHNGAWVAVPFWGSGTINR